MKIDRHKDLQEECPSGWKKLSRSNKRKSVLIYINLKACAYQDVKIAMDFWLLCVLLPSLSLSLFFFLELHLQHMEAPRLGFELELQLPAYTTAMSDLSHICNLHHSSRQHCIFNPVSEARD